MKKLFLIIVTFTLLLSRSSTLISAADPNYQCMGQDLASYMNAVITGVKGKNLTHIKLLSPAFNMTSDTFSGIITGMDTAGANFAGLDGIAGNLYDVAGRGMSSWLDEKTAQFPSSAKGKLIYLTEAGAKDVADKTIDRTTGLKNLNTEINKLIAKNVQAINLFNAFGTNDKFNAFTLSHNQPGNDDMTIVCGGTTCPKPVGVNSAAGFSQAPTFYSDAKALNMGFTVEIARAGSLDAAMAGIISAHNNFMIPIIRIGVGSDSGGFDNPQTYVDFLASVDSRVSKTVFAIAGPNEPDSEFWAAPNCQSIVPAKGSPLTAGFTPLKYNCKDTANPEFHPLRPYPGSPCDPLIPRSVPEAPLEPNLKYNTFACGSSLTPSAEEVFDPYGDNTQYENLPPIDGKYVHTWCEPRPPFTAKTQVTCYRTSEFNVTVDFKNANLGILGNTQDTLTDAQKVNEYLSWYLNGTSSNSVDFSGPLKKLLPYDLGRTLKETVAQTEALSSTEEVHNYLVGDNGARLRGFKNLDTLPVYVQKLIQNLPLSSLEDIPGEVTLSVFRDQAYDQQSPNVQGSQNTPKGPTAPLELIIKSATLAE